MARTRNHLLLIGLAVLGLLLVPMGASAASCDWRDMLDAAANGRQISTHTPACYQTALGHLPADSDNYQPSLRANLIAALQRDEKLSGASSPGASANRRLESAQPAVVAGVRGPVTNLLEGLGPQHVDEVPMPVLALGGAAALLLLAGLGTSLARVRTRRLARTTR